MKRAWATIGTRAVTRPEMAIWRLAERAICLMAPMAILTKPLPGTARVAREMTELVALMVEQAEVVR